MVVIPSKSFSEYIHKVIRRRDLFKRYVARLYQFTDVVVVNIDMCYNFEQLKQLLTVAFHKEVAFRVKV